MDDWDPEFVARLSTARRVIRFDNLGIGESSGETPNTVRGMAEVVPLLLDALGIDAVDLLGWSLGGYVGQTVALTWPERVRHLVIAGSGPGGPDGPPPHPRVAEIAAKTTATRDDVQFLFFTGQQRSGEFNRQKFASDFGISVPLLRPTGNLELRTGFVGAPERCVVAVRKGGVTTHEEPLVGSRAENRGSIWG